MNNDEIQALIQKLKDCGLDDEKILDVFFESFKAGKMSKDDLATLAESLGYELDEEFDKESEGMDMPKEEEVPAEEISEEEAEDLKEIKPGESPEEFQEKVEEAKEGEDEEKPSGDDDEEWEEAKKLFKL